VKDGVFDPL
jgi:hypothetical protein